jgi:IS5 family transposase
LPEKIITKCVAMADETGIELRQRYPFVVKKLVLNLRFRNRPNNIGKAKKAEKSIKTIAGRVVSDLERKLNSSEPENYEALLTRLKQVFKQEKNSKGKNLQFV